jgi:hypothetical protein
MRRLVGSLLLLVGLLEDSNWLRVFDWLARFSFARDALEFIRGWFLMIQATNPFGYLLQFALFVIGLALLVPDPWWTHARHGKPVPILLIGAAIAIAGAWYVWPQQSQPNVSQVDPNLSIKDAKPLSSQSSAFFDCQMGDWSEAEVPKQDSFYVSLQ